MKVIKTTLAYILAISTLCTIPIKTGWISDLKRARTADVDTFDFNALKVGLGTYVGVKYFKEFCFKIGAPCIACFEQDAYIALPLILPIVLYEAAYDGIISYIAYRVFKNGIKNIKKLYSEKSCTITNLVGE